VAEAVDTRPAVAYPRPTTRAPLAAQSLDARIEQLTARLETVPGARGALMEALALRASLFGRVSDLDRMLEAAGEGPERADALMAVHRFDEALAHSDHVATSVQLARHVDLPALESARRKAVAERPSTDTYTALGDVLLAQRRAAEADAAYAEALALYRDVSPLAVAELQFRRGLAWGESGEDPERAAALYADAVKHLPGFVRAQVHLAEIERDLGDEQGAIERVRRVADAEDPEPGGKLAVWLTGGEAQMYQQRTTAAYDALLTKHELAFANHAAEYFSAIGEVERARGLARADLDNRPTSRAKELCEELGC
jgi:tetratricopeptide (TPR) repeat protein